MNGTTTGVGQYTLFGETVAIGPDGRPQSPHMSSRQAQFEAFDAAHPAIYRAFAREAARFLARKRQVAAVAILSLIRPQVSWDADPALRYCVSNTFAPYYARKLIAADPRYAQVFPLRRLKAVGADWFIVRDPTAAPISS